MGFVTNVGLFIALQVEGASPPPEIQRPTSASTSTSTSTAAASPPTSPEDAAATEVLDTAPAVEVPEPTEASPAPAEPAPAEPASAAPVPAPALLPVASGTQPQLQQSPAVAALRLPDRTGRGLMIGAIATGGLGWSMSLGTIGLLSSDCGDFGNCLSRLEALVYLTGIRWLANGTALGLAIPAGVARARYDATKEAIEGSASRNTDAFVKGGAAALGVGAAGWVLLRIGLFSFLQGCSGKGCAVGYFAGLQTSFALATAGSGLLSYGLAHRKQRQQIGTPVQVRVTPQFSEGYGGLSLTGRF